MGKALIIIEIIVWEQFSVVYELDRLMRKRFETFSIFKAKVYLFVHQFFCFILFTFAIFLKTVLLLKDIWKADTILRVLHFDGN